MGRGLHLILFRYYMGPTHRHVQQRFRVCSHLRWPTGKELGGEE
jgi:hypothetical protein